MATEASDGGGADLISSLPDDLLLLILLRLRDTAAAARTSVLALRWRRVWAHLPELCFRYKHRWIYSPRAHERVDAALAAHAAVTAVTVLDIGLPSWKPPQTAAAADPEAPNRLLQFASRRVAGELRLSLYSCMDWGDEIVLPTCERATAIKLSVSHHTLRFQPHPGGGAFAALGTLRIENAYVHGNEIEDVVSYGCPSLTELFLERVILKDGARALSIRSDTVERLEIDVNGYCIDPILRLQIIAPEVRILSPGTLADCHVVAPKLSELSWRGNYDPVRHHIREAGHHLRRLEIAAADSLAPMLMRQFNTVHELQLAVVVWHVRFSFR
ncbi:unnamed protein product [Urochloa humidicola]